jgi:nucleotide-binding universal stress UspA family protein
MFETVIIPLNGSPHAEFAVPYGRDEAFRHGARIVLIHVLPRPELRCTPIAHGGPTPVVPVWPLAELEREELDWLAYLDGVRERFALPENARSVVAVGDPTGRILEEARKYPHPLIVITTGDATGTARPAVSEVARRAMLDGSVPILAIRGPAPTVRWFGRLAATPVAGFPTVVS